MSVRCQMQISHPDWSGDELDLFEWLIQQDGLMDRADGAFTRPDPDRGYFDTRERNIAYAELSVFILHSARSQTRREGALSASRIGKA